MAKEEKTKLPSGKFTHDFQGGAVDAAMKAADAKASKLYNVPVGKIKVIPGFNPRVQSADYAAHRDNLVALIQANGFDSTKPLVGYVAKEGDKNVIYVTDGHTRLDAVNTINADPDTAEKDEIATLPVLVKAKESSLTDLTVALHTSNTGRPLTPFELGIVVKRLLAEDGATKADIARRLAVTPRYLDDVLLLADADGKVKRHVASGAVSSTLAIGLLRKDADTAAEKIEAAISTKGSTKKVTKKDVGPKMQKVKSTVSVAEGTDMKEIVKAVAAKVREAVNAVEGDDDVKLAAVDGTITILIEVPAPEKAAAPAKKKAAKKPAEKPAKKSAPKPAEEPESPPAPAKTAKKAVKKGKDKAKKAKKPADDLGIEGATAVSDDGIDDEPAMLPPVVHSDDIEEEVDI